MRPLPCLVAAVTLTVPSLAFAQGAPESPRRLELTDGRVYVGEILSREAGGIRLRLPQGETLVGFHSLKDLSGSDAAAWSGQRPWEVVVIGADEERRWVEGALRTYPELFVAGDSGYERPVSSAAVGRARDCGMDLTCATTAVHRDRDWSWVVSVEADEEGRGGVLRSRSSFGTGGGSVRLKSLRDPDELLPALDALLELREVPGRSEASDQLMAMGGERAGKDPKKPKDPKGPKPPKAPGDKTPKPPKVQGPVTVGALDALVPIPGYPALKNGDMGGFGMAMAVTLPVTAGWIGATGSESTSLPEHAALSVGGFYVTTVVVNHIIGQRMKSAAVTVAPREGGAQVGVTVPLR